MDVEKNSCSRLCCGKKHDNAFWQTTTMRWASAKQILFFTSATTPGVVFIAFNFGSVKYPR